MGMASRWMTAAVAFAALAGCAAAPPVGAPGAARADAKAGSKDWVARSNHNAQVLLEVQARFSPEQAARTGVTGLDERVSDFTPGHLQRRRDAVRAALVTLEARALGEADPLVAQDLAILILAAKRDIRGSELSERLAVPYVNLPRLVFGSMRSLLEPQVDAARRPAALARVRKYAGLESGTTPVATLLAAETREALARPGLLPPNKLEVENDLQTARFLIDGIEKLFQEFAIAGHEAPVAELKRQLNGYLEFVRAEVLPKARTDFRLPPELYAFRLEQVGVDLAPEELIKRAHEGFTKIQAEMQEVSARIAKKRGLASSDYRDVIRALKKEQIPDAEVLAHYQGRLAEIEAIIRKQQLLTLPSRPARIRLGTPAENAQQPAPHMNAPRMLGNTGEQGEFVLPLGVPGAVEQKYDDFNYAAASWTLTAHEARPGHELQFASMIETGVSNVRAIFAHNSVNVEGWGLYSEAITLPFMPEEGQLISLQLRLQRAVRAFIDPELQLGKWTPESAHAFLTKEVCLSPAFATEEVDRFTFRMPGQATA